MVNKIKHLEIIQAVISRVANNSFQIKGWDITLIVALFALAANNAKIGFVYIAYFPATIFWLLDGYFLSQERIFRKLYDKVRLMTEETVDFSMNTSEFGNQGKAWFSALFSKTLLLFHVGILVTIVIVMLKL